MPNANSPEQTPPAPASQEIADLASSLALLDSLHALATAQANLIAAEQQRAALAEEVRQRTAIANDARKQAIDMGLVDRLTAARERVLPPSPKPIKFPAPEDQPNAVPDAKPEA